MKRVTLDVGNDRLSLFCISLKNPIPQIFPRHICSYEVIHACVSVPL